MAANLTVAQLTTQRDNLYSALDAISSSPVQTYTIGDRTITYEDRARVIQDIRRLTGEILLRTPGDAANARGRNRMDFSTWD